MAQLRAADFAIGTKLSTGVTTVCSVVVEAIYRQTGTPVTLKIYQKPLSEGAKEHLAREREVLGFINDKVTPRLMAAFEDATGYVLVFERNELVKLQRVGCLRWTKKIEEKIVELVGILWEDCCVAHGDIKLDNFLFTQGNSGLEEKFYLIDFGHAVRLPTTADIEKDRDALAKMFRHWKDTSSL